MFTGVMRVGFEAGQVTGSPFGYLANNHFTSAAVTSVFMSWYNGPQYQATHTLFQLTANTVTTIAVVKRT